MTRIAAITLLLYVSAVAAAQRHSDLESWFNRDLVPYVENALRDHPRFRNEALRFVVLREDRPQSEGSALALSLRDRLRDAMSRVPGVRIAWQGDHPGVGLVAGAQPLDCTKNDADYFIALEVDELRSGRVSIRVRALDIEERAWVPDFDREWQGELTRQQFVDLRRISADPTFRGERDAPWDSSETDLMAAQLAYELGCKLLGQTAGEYVVSSAAVNGEVDRTAALVELVGNNLAGVRALQFGMEDANAIIEGKAHRIDDDLFQYWITVTPTDPESAMTALSANAYVHIEDQFLAADLVPESVVDIPAPQSQFLTNVSVVRLGGARACSVGDSLWSEASVGRERQRDCYGLDVAANADAVIFFLNHQLNNGLVRLSNHGCQERALARIVRAGDRVHQGVAAIQSGDWSAGDGWSLGPRHDVFYVIASTDTKASRALSGHIERLPRRCSESVRPGLEGKELKRWLEELAAIAENWPAAVDWRSIRVKEVY